MIRNNNSNLYILVFYFLICLKATLILPFYELNAENIEKLKFHEKSIFVPKTKFSDTLGNTYTLDDFLGKVIIVNLWATWCAPCIDEMPTLISLQNKITDEKIVIIAISQDRNGEKVVRPFIKKNEWVGIKFFISDDLSFAKETNIRGLPTTLVIGGDGRELARLEGTIKWDDQQVINIIKNLASR